MIVKGVWTVLRLKFLLDLMGWGLSLYAFHDVPQDRNRLSK